MKILLLKDIPGVGRKNDIKDVTEGYARNFLFAKKLAVAATDAKIRIIAHEKNALQHKETADKKKYKDIADKLASTQVTIVTKVGEKGKAFGSVGAGHIKTALDKQGIAIEEEWIALKEPIKTTGITAVPLKFPYGVSGSVNVTIKPE